jgi:hypothetical protein
MFVAPVAILVVSAVLGLVRRLPGRWAKRADPTGERETHDRTIGRAPDC